MIANELRNEITSAQRAEWTASSPSDWANESFALTNNPMVGYCIPASRGRQYDTNNLSPDAGMPLKIVSIDQAYVERAAPVIRDRLRRAAVRLAHLLDQALEN